MRRTIVLLCISLVLAFIMAEGVLWLIEKTAILMLPKDRYEPYKRLYMISPDKEVSFEHRPNADVLFKSDKGTKYTMRVITNSQGLREETDIPFNKPAGTKRIIGLGDSIVFGASVENDQTFLRTVEKALSNKNYSVQTINFGVGSSNPRLEYFYLQRKEALKYSPDMILLGICLNDFDTRYRRFSPELGNWYYPSGASNQKTMPVYMGLKEFMLQFRLVRFLNNSIDRIAMTKPDPDADALSKQEFKHWLAKIKEYCDSGSVPLIVVIFPYKNQLEHAIKNSDTDYKLQKSVKEICKELGIPAYDLTSDLTNYAAHHNINLDTLYWDPFHPWREGHRIIGELIACWIKENGWLDKKADLN